jgi:hypothetical protein
VALPVRFPAHEPGPRAAARRALPAVLILSAAVSWGCAFPLRPEPSPPAPGAPATSDASALVGQWVGPTAKEGTLTLFFRNDGRFRYAFSGSNQRHAAGLYRIEGDSIRTRADGSDPEGAQTWTFAVDQGRLRLTMHDGQVYHLMRRLD